MGNSEIHILPEVSVAENLIRRSSGLTLEVGATGFVVDVLRDHGGNISSRVFFHPVDRRPYGEITGPYDMQSWPFSE